MEFVDPSGTQPMVVSIVSIRGDLNPIPGTKTLEAFDLSGMLIGSQTLQDSDPAPLTVSAPGIHRARVYSSSATVGFDDLRFDDPRPPCSSCPADLTCDGLVDFGDYLEFLNLYDAQDPRADLNQDGLVDFSDYLEFLNLYDAGC